MQARQRGGETAGNDLGHVGGNRKDQQCPPFDQRMSLKNPSQAMRERQEQDRRQDEGHRDGDINDGTQDALHARKVGIDRGHGEEPRRTGGRAEIEEARDLGSGHQHGPDPESAHPEREHDIAHDEELDEDDCGEFHDRPQGAFLEIAHVETV